jgi:hypothetical protein
MKLNEMSNSRKVNAKKALKEHFEVKMNFDRLGLNETKTMLKKVRGLITEARTSKTAHTRHQSPAYMKMVMLEQALTGHYGDLRVQQQIMLENEEVQKSQVILAAQDMIDSIQKMVEQISKMKVEELPAVVTGVNNEIGTSEGQQFEGTCTEALTTLEGALTAAKQSLTGALGIVTGEGGGEMDADAFGGDEDMGDEDMDDAGMDDMDAGGEGMDDLADMGDDAEELPELPEPEEELGGAGRGRR